MTPRDRRYVIFFIYSSGFGLRLGLGFPRGIWSERKTVLRIGGNGRLLFGIPRRHVLKFVALRWQKQLRKFARFTQPALGISCVTGL